MPGISNQESATNAVLYLIDVISNPATIAPFVYIGSRKLKAIRSLAGILNKQHTNARIVFVPRCWEQHSEKKTQETPHKDAAQIRVEFKHGNPLNTNAFMRMKLPSKWQTLSPT